MFKKDDVSYPPEKTNVKIPALYKCTGIICIVVFAAIIILMFLDTIFAITNFGPVPYIMVALFCLTMRHTNKLALEDWKKNVCNSPKQDS